MTRVFEWTIPEFNEIRKRLSSAIPKIRDKGNDYPDGWSPVHPDWTPLLNSLEHIKLKKGYKLSGAVYTAGGNGNGLVYILPENVMEPKEFESDENYDYYGGICREDPTPPRKRNRSNKDDFPSHIPVLLKGKTRLTFPDFDDLPSHIPVLPKGGDYDFLPYLELDDDPKAYLELVILLYEFAEFGAFWHGVRWGVMELYGPKEILPTIRDEDKNPLENESLEQGSPKLDDLLNLEGGKDSDPQNPGDQEVSDRNDIELDFSVPDPVRFAKESNPKVYYHENDVTVVFCSYSELGSQALTQHYFKFDPKTLHLDYKSEVVASGSEGFIF